MNLINVIRRILPGVIVAISLSACQQAVIKQRDSVANLCQPEKDPDSKSCHWTHQMQPVLNRDFRDAARYAGQQCLVRMEWQRSGRYAVTQTQGDEALCLRAWQLVAQTRGLPPPPEPGQPAWFGFAPRG
ncbi:cell envelope integrity TolA C-terminal domain-containing protein [uncultured Pantoea sp.]|uniref:cell envelope integrity TolA C-terminal domain-containing protein n=1 Tax=uncultured Pantoea sp. TaxID=218084 RepID=UPI0027D9728D|nr:cell envelope integrity TolA C-terminal domain-containing protein [uncultured Pantoea sp.]